MKTPLDTDTGSIQTDPCICLHRYQEIAVFHILFQIPAPTSCCRELPTAHAPELGSRGGSTAFACAVLYIWKAIFASIAARWCFPHTHTHSSRKWWKVHLFRHQLQWALAYLGKLPIHHRRGEFSRHECLFYEHLHSMNAQSKKFINVRIVHMGNTLYL